MKLLLNSVAVAIIALLAVSTVEAHPTAKPEVKYDEIISDFTNALANTVKALYKKAGYNSVDIDVDRVKLEEFLKNPLEKTASYLQDECTKTYNLIKANDKVGSEEKNKNEKMWIECKNLWESMRSNDVQKSQVVVQEKVASLLNVFKQIYEDAQVIPEKLKKIQEASYKELEALEKELKARGVSV